MCESPPEQTGSRRLPWGGLPQSVRSGIEDVFGRKAAVATSLPGGFSEGLAARLESADGRKAFAKAVDATAAPAVGAFHRREIATVRALPPGTPSPRLLGSFEDGGWVALVFEHVDGTLPAQPWREAELERVLDALTGLAERLTPAPALEVAPGAPRLGGWARLAGDHRAMTRLAELAPGAALDLDLHLRLEADLDEATAGETLTHGDLYPFNVLLTGERAVFVDWPHARVGPAHADLVTLLSSVALSGIDPEPFVARAPLTSGVEPEAVDVLISAQAGFLLASSCTAGPAADPHLVRMMTRLGLACLRWLSARRGTNGRPGRASWGRGLPVCASGSCVVTGAGRSGGGPGAA
ncbi:aminoglycoside phosphotransferase family protein [Streptomyces bathyalis]|uniref:aminoglycoside phosphotransferase family protein n=1 Tax=Streptomyces bathyalis TaxID=2710756 RepID=UPI001FE8F13A|nr:phosphotransferase [Streptomyces bathyalis]